MASKTIWKGLSAGVEMTNLLNYPIRYTQSGTILQRWRRGSSFYFELSYAF